jgi:O-antigen/teichoic acid export membrane protein
VFGAKHQGSFLSGPSRHDGARLTSGTLLARNAYINLVSQLAPVLIAIFAIPLLIKVLGTERFGVLALAWVVMGYFGFFDFGLGRATTKFVAEYHARNETEAVPELVWSSITVHLFLGLLGGGLLALITPWLTQSVLNIPGPLLSETRISFYLLAASVPLIVATAALRGVLEAIQRFDLVNVIKLPASVLNYLGPLAVLYFIRGLVAVILFLVVTRAVVLLAHLVLCLRVMPELSRGFRFNAARVSPMLGFGGWLTVFSFVGPSIASIDRFMIGAFVSLSAVTYYTTSFEAVTKLTVFSASLLAVLFPAFTTMTVTRYLEVRRLYLRALKYLLVLVAPIVGVILALAYELLSLWVAPEFALDSAPVARWLAVGILIHILGHVSFTVLQGIGRAEVPAKLQLVQLPFYVLLVWALVSLLGITGVAIAWTLRATIDALMLFVAANKLLPSPTKNSEEHFFWTGAVVICGFLLLFLGAGSALEDMVIQKIAVVTALTGALVFWEWFLFLGPADRRAFLEVVKPILTILKR